jgi:hypothetical protein
MKHLLNPIRDFLIGHRDARCWACSQEIEIDHLVQHLEPVCCGSLTGWPCCNDW